MVWLAGLAVKYTVVLHSVLYKYRAGKSAKTSATRNALYSAVVVNGHMYPRPLLYHFSCFYNPF